MQLLLVLELGLVSSPLEVLDGELARKGLLDFQLGPLDIRVRNRFVVGICHARSDLVHRLELLLFERLLHFVDNAH